MAHLKSILFPHLYRLPAAAGIRYRLVLKYLGGILLILGGNFIVLAIFSFTLGEPTSSYLFYLSLFLVLAISGRYLYQRVPEREVTASEAAGIASLSFLIASFTGALPFLFLGGMPVTDAWFEAMSGFTTTGFSLIDVKAAQQSLLLLRALSQWLGGMGFVVITVSLLLVTGSPAVALLKEGVEEKLFPRITRHIHVIVATYLAVTVFGVAALLVSGLDPFSAVCYAFSGVSTGGFAVHEGSVGEIPHKVVSLPLIMIMLMGATNFILYYQSWKTSISPGRAFFSFLKSPQVLALVIITSLTGFAVSLTIEREGRWLHGFFTAVSAQTTTGFYTLEPSGMPVPALTVLIISMFIGGAIGSTAGGIKLFRFLEFFKGVNRFIISHHYPKEAVLPRGIIGKSVVKEELPGIFYVIAIYAVTIIAASVVFTWYGFDPLKSVFEVTSAVSTVGLSSGIVSGELENGLKILLIFLMWAGRLEFVPVFIWAYSFALRSHR